MDIDRDRAAALGVTPQAIEEALYTAYGSRRVSTIYGQNNTYEVVMELEPEYQLDAGSLSLLYVSSTSGKLVPLSARGDDPPDRPARCRSTTRASCRR